MLFAESAFGQKKPSFMILPNDNWCQMRYYTQVLDNQGTKTTMPDYERAFREDTELGPVVSMIGGLLAEDGFNVKDVENAAKSLRTRIAQNSVITTKQGGTLAENDLDIMKNKVKADILIMISWHSVKKNGGRAFQYTIDSFDSYSGYRIPASLSGISESTNDGVNVVLARELDKKLKEFEKKIQTYFDGVCVNGREIQINIHRWDAWDKDLDTPFGDDTLLDIIEHWMEDNTVNGSFNLSDCTEDQAIFETVHIPTFDSRNKSLDARGFANNLAKYLRTTCKINVKLISSGLGEATLVLGEPVNKSSNDKNDDIF